ncbi:hypothetical protein L9F63_001495, partial [Diploptera punctata]
PVAPIATTPPPAMPYVTAAQFQLSRKSTREGRRFFVAKTTTVLSTDTLARQCSGFVMAGREGDS